MGCDVYANCDEIACKAGMGKVIAAFPDVCLSPPSPPAGPIPVPYPDTSFSKDTTNGSKTVKIKGQEVMLKDQSFYKTAPLGDEAATQGLGAGVITHVITGKTYFVAWSMDVKFEGQNVDRHTDLTTSNHASPMANGQPPMVNTAFMAPSGPEKEGKCACCGKRHAGQQGGITVTEDQWYGLDEGPEIERGFKNLQNHPPNPINAKAVEKWQTDLSDLTKRDAALQQRKAAVRNARDCGLTPSPPCNVYFVFRQRADDTKPPKPRGATKRYIPPRKPQTTRARMKGLIEDEWDANRAKYKQRRGIADGEKINHKTPKAAGGCPTGPNNLVPDSKLSAQCQQVDAELTTAQDDASRRWDAVMSPGVK